MPLTVDQTVCIEPDRRPHPTVAPTTCRVRVYEWVGRRAPVVIVSELADNPGLSVTNAAEHVWRAVGRLLETSRFTLIEHYGPDSYAAGGNRYQEQFDEVTVDVAGHPSWRSLSRDEVRALTGETGWLSDG